MKTLLCSMLALFLASSAYARGQAETEEVGRIPCVLAVPSAQVTVHDTAQGAALLFTASDPKETDELQRRVRDFAAHRLALSALPRASERTGVGGSGPTGAPPPSPSALDAADVRVETLSAGARVVFSSPDVNRVRAVQDAVRQEAQSMRTSACPVGATPPGPVPQH